MQMSLVPHTREHRESQIGTEGRTEADLRSLAQDGTCAATVKALEDAGLGLCVIKKKPCPNVGRPQYVGIDSWVVGCAQYGRSIDSVDAGRCQWRVTFLQQSA